MCRIQTTAMHVAYLLALMEPDRGQALKATPLRGGGRWGLAQIHVILTRTTYIGEHRFNTRSHKARERKPESEIMTMAVPPLIDRKAYTIAFR